MTTFVYVHTCDESYKKITDFIIQSLNDSKRTHVALPYGSDADGFLLCLKDKLNKLSSQSREKFIGYQSEEIIGIKEQSDISLSTIIKNILTPILSPEQILFINTKPTHLQSSLAQMERYKIDIAILGINPNGTILGLTEIPKEKIWFKPISLVYGENWREKLQAHFKIPFAVFPSHLISLGRTAAIDSDDLYLMLHGESKQPVLNALKQKKNIMLIEKILDERANRGKTTIIFTDLPIAEKK